MSYIEELELELKKREEYIRQALSNVNRIGYSEDFKCKEGYAYKSLIIKRLKSGNLSKRSNYLLENSIRQAWEFVTPFEIILSSLKLGLNEIIMCKPEHMSCKKR